MRLLAKKQPRFRPVLEGLEDRRVPAVLLNELSVNLPGGTDTPWEYAEMRGTPGMSMTDIYFVQFEGNISITAPTQRGTADFVQSLTGFSPGPNGLLVIKSTSGGHTMPAGTTVIGNTHLDTGSGAFENGAATYMLIHSTTPIVVGTDYDADDDNVLELPGSAVVLDSVGWFEDYTDEYVYTNVILDQAAGTPDAACRFSRSNSTSVDAWYNGDLTGSSDAVEFDPAELSPNFPTGGKLTPGAKNSHALPMAPVSGTSILPTPIPPPPLPSSDSFGSSNPSDPTLTESHRLDDSGTLRPAAHVVVSADALFANLFDIGL